MKSPEYVYTVTHIYRRLLDEGRAATKSENDQLRRAFSRGGFTDGYFTGKTDRGMTGIRSESDKQDSRDMAATNWSPEKVRVRASVTFRLGEPAEMTLTYGERSVTAFGGTPVPAENSPLTIEGVKTRLAKMGNTLLSLDPEDISLILDENINLPPSALNSLRRQAAEMMESQARDLNHIKYIPAEMYKEGGAHIITAQFFSEESYLAAKKFDGRLLSTINIAFLPHTASINSIVGAGGVYLPPVVFDSELDGLQQRLAELKNAGVMYALVGNIGQISLARSLDFKLVGDFRLNVTNRESAMIYRDMGINHLVLSPELTLPQARDIGGLLITYGRIPLMITERCFIGENFGCNNCNKCSLTDRKGEKFPMMREVQHRNIIFNSIPTYMGDRRDELCSARLRSNHLLFTTESGEEIVEVLRAHCQGRPLSVKVRRVGRR